MDDAAVTDAPTTETTDPAPPPWWSLAALVSGALVLAGSIASFISKWNEDGGGDPFAAQTGAVDRFIAFTSTLSPATVTLLIVGLFIELPRGRRWILFGAAAYALAFLVRALSEQRTLSLLG